MSKKEHPNRRQKENGPRRSGGQAGISPDSADSQNQNHNTKKEALGPNTSR